LPYPPLLDPLDPKKLFRWPLPPPLLEKKLDPPELLLSLFEPLERKKLLPLFPLLPLPPLFPLLLPLPKKEFEAVPLLSLFCLLKKLSA